MENIVGQLVGLLIMFGVLFIIFLVLREFVVWYLKINKIVEKQTKTINTLQEILEEIKKQGGS